MAHSSDCHPSAMSNAKSTASWTLHAAYRGSMAKGF
ncbi:MAG: hypothetical protein ACI9K8_000423, partial [Reinekea sp.]